MDRNYDWHGGWLVCRGVALVMTKYWVQPDQALEIGGALLMENNTEMAIKDADDRKGFGVDLQGGKRVEVYWSHSSGRFDLVMIRPQTEDDVSEPDIPQHRFIDDGKVFTSVGFSREAGFAICSLLIEWMRHKA